MTQPNILSLSSLTVNSPCYITPLASSKNLQTPPGCPFLSRLTQLQKNRLLRPLDTTLPSKKNTYTNNRHFTRPVSSPTFFYRQNAPQLAFRELTSSPSVCFPFPSSSYFPHRSHHQETPLCLLRKSRFFFTNSRYSVVIFCFGTKVCMLPIMRFSLWLTLILYQHSQLDHRPCPASPPNNKARLPCMATTKAMMCFRLPAFLKMNTIRPPSTV